MRIYVDSSALLKRVIIEPESHQLVTALDKYQRDSELLVTSTLAWIEVSRTLRSRAKAELSEVKDDVDAALSGVSEYSISPAVASLARRLDPTLLRSLDAIHLASAVLLDASLMITYDHRLIDALPIYLHV